DGGGATRRVGLDGVKQRQSGYRFRDGILGKTVRSEFRQSAQIVTRVITTRTPFVQCIAELFQVWIDSINEAETDGGMDVLTRRNRHLPACQCITAFEKEGIIGVNPRCPPMRFRRAGDYLAGHLQEGSTLHGVSQG